MLRLLALIFILNTVLVLLLIPGPGAWPLVAAEALVLVGILLLLPGRLLGTALRWGIGVIYAVTAVFVMADSVVRASLGRPLNLYYDFTIGGAGLNLMVANLGELLTSLLLGLSVLLVCVVAAMIATLVRQISDHRELLPPHNRVGLVVAVFGLALLALPQNNVGATMIAIGSGQMERALDAHEASTRFRQQILGTVKRADHELDGLEQLAGKDVILAFVESYGVSAVFDERYRPVVGPSLEALEDSLTENGLSIVSGRLRSPVQGGQSWLAHSTVLSGLWIESQADHDALVASDFPTLIDDFQKIGHRSVAVMPAITMAWPEGKKLGYDRIYHARNMGYHGPPLHWVTMPDQYTWSWFERRVRAPSPQPVFAELALISSHAPWVPVLPVLDDWSTIADGKVFEPWRDAGETPASLWQDHDRVREHYARSVGYALDVVAGYALRHVDENTLLIVLGDHQAAPLITGEGASRDVPVHIISADRSLVAPFLGSDDDLLPGLEGFQAGVWPRSDREGPTMDRLREFLHRLF